MEYFVHIRKFLTEINSREVKIKVKKKALNIHLSVIRRLRPRIEVSEKSHHLSWKNRSTQRVKTNTQHTNLEKYFRTEELLK